MAKEFPLRSRQQGKYLFNHPNLIYYILHLKLVSILLIIVVCSLLMKTHIVLVDPQI
jgi:hypothetical protein